MKIGAATMQEVLRLLREALTETTSKAQEKDISVAIGIVKEILKDLDPQNAAKNVWFKTERRI